MLTLLGFRVLVIFEISYTDHLFIVTLFYVILFYITVNVIVIIMKMLNCKG